MPIEVLLSHLAGAHLLLNLDTEFVLLLKLAVFEDLQNFLSIYNLQFVMWHFLLQFWTIVGLIVVIPSFTMNVTWLNMFMNNK